MADKLDTITKVVATVAGLGGVAKIIHWAHRSVSNAIVQPILEKMEEQMKLGRMRDEHIATLKAALDTHIDKFAEANKTLFALEKEWRPNGGSSALDRIIRAVDRQSATILALHQDNPQGIFISDTEGKCTWVNATLLRITGHSEEEMLGWNWINQLDEADVDMVRAAWASAFKESREYKRTQTYVTSTGAKVMAHVIARPVYAPNDTIIEWVGFVTQVA